MSGASHDEWRQSRLGREPERAQAAAAESAAAKGPASPAAEAEHRLESGEKTEAFSGDAA
jgi:hypothetical protein